MRTVKFTMALIVFWAVSHTPDMLAAESTAEPAGADAAIEEVIVTATRRDTTLEETALSISALSGQQLEDRGLLMVADAVGLVAGVTPLTNQPGGNDITIRGVNTSTTTFSSTDSIVNSTTAVYLDQLPVTSTIAKTPDFRLVDLNRVEVLRGPQGTLFGQSAMGGAVRYITNKPTSEALSGRVGGYGSTTADGSGNFGVDGHVNVPLGFNAALRLVGYSYRNAGFVDVVGTADIEDANEESTTGGRIVFRWDVSDTTTVDLGYLYHEVDLDSIQSISSTYTPTGNPLNNGVAFGLMPVDEDRLAAQHLSPTNDEFEIFSLELGSAFEAFDALLILGRKDIRAFNLFEGAEFAPNTESFGKNSNTANVTIDTAEFRLVSTDELALLDWIFGIWYEDAAGNMSADATISGQDLVLFGGFFVLPVGTVAIDAGRDLTYEELSLWGEVAVDFGERWRLAVGYRRANVDNDYQWVSADGFFDPLIGRNLLVGVDQTTSERVDTYKINLEFAAADGLFLFAQASSGYRPGGFNPGNALAGIPDNDYGSDSLWSYEIGVRSSWLEDRLTANLFAYRTDWSDIQLNTSSGAPFFYSSVQNAGEAKVAGVELELVLWASDRLTLASNFALTDSELAESAVTALGTAPGRNGDELPGTPPVALSVSADWQNPVGNGATLLANATFRHVGDRTATLGSDLELPSYELFNLRLGMEFPSGLGVSLFADNVANKTIVNTITPTALAGFRYLGINRPRTIGLRAGLHF